MSERPVAIVTGASSGIGRATAIELAGRGYAVVLAARRADRLAEVAAECDRAVGARPGGAALPVPTDVTSSEQVRALVARAVAAFARVDVMVNNAGVGHFGRVHEIDPADMRAIFEVNFFGVLHGCQAVAPVMIRQRSGHIFTLSSVIGKRGSPFHGAYCATKFAVCGLTDCLRVEMRPYGVRVTCVCPALTRTEFFHRADGRRVGSRYTRPEKMTPPEAVARGIARAVGKDRPEIVLTAGGRFLVLVSALWPRLADRIMKLYHDDLVRRLRAETTAPETRGSRRKEEDM